MMNAWLHNSHYLPRNRLAPRIGEFQVSGADPRRSNGRRNMMRMTLFLRRILMLDALSCFGMGIGLALAASALHPLLGLPEPLLFGAGLALLPIGAFILWVGTRQNIAPLFVYAIIGGNLLWAIESVLVVDGAVQITMAGTVVVIGQALAVAGLTLLEAIGLVQSRRSTEAITHAAA
jgi:hypothetical protein